MALVAYSDSEASDNEDTGTATASAPTPATFNASKPSSIQAKSNLTDTLPKPAITNTNSSQTRKIKFDLPSIQPEPTTGEENADEPLAKKARTAGAFSGFNSLLPAPKRASVPKANAPRAGVSLRTSSEAAFTRNPVPRLDDGDEDGNADGGNEGLDDGGFIGRAVANGVEREGDNVEVKIVGKTTRFKPLSVAGKKKAGVKKVKEAEETKAVSAPVLSKDDGKTVEQEVTEQPQLPPPEKPRPKRSLFAVSQPQDEGEMSAPTTSNTYESIISQPQPTSDADLTMNSIPQSTPNIPNSTSATSNPLTDLNLTPAQQRRLFGRHAKDPSTINITHFNTDAEYAANEQLRQAGEVVEHRAVKAIAPGKHSLQQLVNNARSQQESLEDKWAAGRRERGEGAGKYGWGR